MLLFGERTVRAILGITIMSLASLACRGRDGDLPRRYRDLAVPGPRLASAEARARGRKLFLEHCALCHGDRADGRGVRREGLTSPPRDFTDPAWRRRTSPRRIFFTIREGSRGTPMPAWGILTDEEIWDLTACLISTGEGR
jgi:mono/diheme cytochrome c family protein